MVPQSGSVDKFQEEVVSWIKQSTDEKTVQILGMQALLQAWNTNNLIQGKNGWEELGLF